MRVIQRGPATHQIFDRKSVSIRMPDDAGFAAGKAGEFSNACPYPPLSIESLSWHSGYIEGKAQRQMVENRPAQRGEDHSVA